jgi:hypothetical protein
MILARGFLVFTVAISVAMLPLAGGMARAQAIGSFMSGMHSDCCPHGKACEKNEMDDCASMAGCALKCFNYFASVFQMVLKPAHVGGPGPTLADLSFPSDTIAPPLPPPRV